MRLTDYLDQLASEIRALVPEETVTVATELSDIVSSLDAGLIAIWVTPPDEISIVTGEHAHLDLAPIVLSSNYAAPLAGLDEIEVLLDLLVDELAVTKVVLDSLTLGSSPAYPAAQLHMTALIERN